MGKVKIESERELLERLDLLGVTDEQQKKQLICSLIGHSKIQTYLFGYYYCARCDEQVGDRLGSIYPDATNVVLVGHKCPTCKANYKNLTWKDKIFCLDQFADES